MNINRISRLPSKQAPEEISSDQLNFDLKVAKQTEIQGIGMGVLDDGTAFLHQRGLARLCGVENAHIGTISSQWNDAEVKPRIAKIKELLAERGLTFHSPHIEVKYGAQKIFAYPDTACLAILEYYSFEAGNNFKEQALKNFRTLAGKGLQDFVYAQVGYDPRGAVPIAWQQFHDRVTVAYGKIPIGYFSIFKEVSDIIVTLIRNGADVGVHFVPDISIGKAWSKHWTDGCLDARYGARERYPHDYPDYFPQAASNPQPAFCYPDAALAEFRRWVRAQYIGEGKFAAYLGGKAKSQELPASFVQLALRAYSPEAA